MNSEKPVLVRQWRGGKRWFKSSEPTHQVTPLDSTLPMPGTWVSSEYTGNVREVYGHAPGPNLLVWDRDRTTVYSDRALIWTPCDPPEEPKRCLRCGDTTGADLCQPSGCRFEDERKGERRDPRSWPDQRKADRRQG